jgi:pyruvate dehydrogenase E1 component alpha subunit
MYEALFRIRFFEDRIQELARTKAVPGYLHTYLGSEAIAVGVMAALQQDDWITSTYRSHGHAIAKNVDLFQIAAEIHGRSAGICKGRGGSMHISDFDKGMLGAFGIVAAGPAIALGAALQERRKGSSRIAASFFGDGAVHNGVFHEAAGLAKLWNAPLLLVCENNGYAEATATDWHLNTKTIADMMAAYAMPASTVDGMDMFTVYEAAKAAIDRMRAGGGPELIEFKSYRFSGQYEGDEQAYQPPAEMAKARERDPILLARLMAAQVGSSGAALTELEAGIRVEVDDAFARAEQAPWPAPEDALEEVYVSYPEAQISYA